MEARALRTALALSSSGTVIAAAVLVVVAAEPFRMVEGLDVLAASNHIAPVSLAWMDDLDVRATRPEYLRQPPVDVVPLTGATLPRRRRSSACAANQSILGGELSSAMAR